MTRRHNNNDVLADVAKGALAGAAATWVMGQATSYLYEQENKQARQMEDDAREGKTAYGVAAEKAAGMVGRELSEEERKKMGSAIHWVLGAGAGAVYGAARGRLSGADAAGGLLFGFAFWLLVDEGANVALGLTPGPTEFPWQTHARGLVAHLVFGMTAEAVLAVADQMV